MRRWITVAYCICLAPGAYAQNAQLNVQREIERLQERERERLRESEQAFERSQIAPPQGVDDQLGDEPSADSAACRPVDRVEIDGMTRYDPQSFLAQSPELVGPCVSVRALNALRRKITNQYIRDGYITSQAFVIEAPPAARVLTVKVVEGRVDSVVSKGQGGRAYSASELALAFPGIAGAPLNLRDLEQGVDQLARITSAEPTIDILPGAMPEASGINVARRRVASWIRPAVSVNNDGTRLTGRRLVTGTLDIDSPIGIADVWSLYYLTDLERERFRGIEAFGGFASIPYGASTLILSANRFRSRSVLRNGALAFQNSNAGFNGSVGLTHLVYRDRDTKILVVGTMSIYDTLSRIQSIRLSTNSYRVVSGELGIRAQRRVGRDLLSGEVAFSQGVDILGANAADIGPGSDGVRASKLTASTTYQAGLDLFGVRTRYLASFRGQVGLNTALPVDRLIIGGSSTVRGFRDDGISGRTGYVLRQQIGVDLFRTFVEDAGRQATQVSAFAGYDQGGIAPQRGDPFERGFLQSATAGLRMQNRRLAAEISAAVPWSAPETVERKKIEFAASLRLTI